MGVCPKCGSQRFHYELRSAGTRSKTNYYRTGVKDSWLIPAGEKTYKSQRQQKAVGFCPDCGYIEDKQAEEKGCLYYFLMFIILPISVPVWIYKTDSFQLDKKWRILLIIVFLALFYVLNAGQPAQP